MDSKKSNRGQGDIFDKKAYGGIYCGR